MNDTQFPPETGNAAGGATGSALPVLPPVAALLEILLLVVVPGLLDFYVPAFPTLNDLHPHFYWLPVVLLSVQYGSLSGLLAAGTAILLAALLGWPEQDIGENHFTYLLRIWLQPVLWIATAVVLGQIRLRQIEQKELLLRTVQELTVQRQSIAGHARNLRHRCDHLERIIAAKREPDAKQLLAALGQINSADTGAAELALHDALRLAFGTCRVAIYFLDGDQLRLAAQHGEGAPAVASVGIDERLYRAVIFERRSLSVLNAGDETDLGGLGLAAVPISRGHTAAAGLLLLQGAGPDVLDEHTIWRLTAIAAMIASRREDAGLRSAASPTVALALSGNVRSGPTGNRSWRRVKWQNSERRPVAVRAGNRSG